MGEKDYTVRVTSISTDGTIQPFLGTDPRRVTVMFSCTAAVFQFVAYPTGWGTIDPAVLSPNGAPLRFDCDKWGPLVGGAWSVSSSIMGQTIYATELLRLER